MFFLRSAEVLARLPRKASSRPTFLRTPLPCRAVVSAKVAELAADARKYRGVCYNKHLRAYEAKLTVQGHKHFLGMFKSACQAAKAYDHRLRSLCPLDRHRLQRCLNFPSKEEAAYQETAVHARGRGLAMNSGSFGAYRKEAQAFELLRDALARSFMCQQYEIRRVSGASKADALLLQRTALTETGLPIQLKASAAHGSQARKYCFSRVGGYDGMLVLFIALEGGHIWAAAGHQLLARKTLNICVECESDKRWRLPVHDVGLYLWSCFHDHFRFPHMSLSEATMDCRSTTHRIEASAHLQLKHLFACSNMRLVLPGLLNSTVDSVLQVQFANGGSSSLRLQEKAVHRKKNRRLQCEDEEVWWCIGTTGLRHGRF